MDAEQDEMNLEGVRAYFSNQGDVIAAYIFGSIARNQAHPESDLDVAILLEAVNDQQAMLEQQLEIVAALEAFTEREVQVALLNLAPPLLAYQVIKEGRRVYERSQQERINFEVRAMKLYFDVQPMLAYHHRLMIKQIREVGLGRRRSPARTLEAARRVFGRFAKSPER